MTAMRDVEWLPPLLERRRDPDRLARIRASRGSADPAVCYFMASDWLPEATAELKGALFTRTHLDHELADLVGYAAAAETPEPVLADEQIKAIDAVVAQAAKHLA